MTILFNKKHYNVSDLLDIISFSDAGSGFNQSTYKSKRQSSWIKGIVLHHNRGMVPDEVYPADGNKKANVKKDISLARYQGSSDTRKASWDFTVDSDGSVAQSNDPYLYYTWHANTVNADTVGIEITQEQSRPWNLYEVTLDKAVVLLDILTFKLGIQRQVLCYNKNNGSWIEGVVPGRMQHPNDGTSKSKGHTGHDCIGIYGHRNVTTNKGPGDPSNHIFDKLREAGYDIFDPNIYEDMDTWRNRQKQMAMPPNDIDGLPGPHTVSVIKEYQKQQGKLETGIWVERPIDAELIRIFSSDNK